MEVIIKFDVGEEQKLEEVASSLNEIGCKYKATVNKKSELEMLLQIVSEESGISVNLLRSKRRDAKIVLARKVYFFIAMRDGYASATDVAVLLNKDHATIIHHIKDGANLISSKYTPFVNLLRNVDGKIQNSSLR